MRVGMLWYDNDPVDIPTRVRRAAEYYRQKYGAPPGLCCIHPSMLNGDKQVDGIELRASRYVLLNHFWLGREEAPEN